VRIEPLLERDRDRERHPRPTPRSADCALERGEARFDVVLQILARQVPLDAAIANRRAKIEGSARVLRKLPDLFDLATARR